MDCAQPRTGMVPCACVTTLAEMIWRGADIQRRTHPWYNESNSHLGNQRIACLDAGRYLRNLGKPDTGSRE